MANLGDVGMAKRAMTQRSVFALNPSLIINDGTSDRSWHRPIPLAPAWNGTNYRNKPTTPFVVVIADAVAGENYILAKNGIAADVPRYAEVDGVKFYNLDDGTYIASSAESGDTWRVVVTGTSYTLELLAGGGGITVADNFYGGVA